MTTFTNSNKSSTVLTNAPLSGTLETWDADNDTWDASQGTWDNPGAVIFTNQTKNTTALTNQTKN